jgi:hypothetical protein
MPKLLELKKETRTAQDDKGSSYSYDVYFVEVNGIKIELKAKDSTAKQILKTQFE